MSRTPKHPGLQAKFDSLLAALLANGTSLKTTEIQEAARTRAGDFALSAEEVEDLRSNFANYIKRAKDGGLVSSNGAWGGYRLSSAGEPATRAAETPDDDGPEATDAPRDAGRRHWESFLHLPLTMALSEQFSARVQSLSNALDNVRWGNPDMLMLRSSALSEIDDLHPLLDPAAFRIVDGSPECILASIEVKGGLDRDRAKVFTAISETAANSRWANEAWLVFVDWNPTDAPLADELVSLARSVEIGLVEVRIGEGGPLRLIVHHTAPTRPTLRIDELPRERVGILRAAQELLAKWKQGEMTFLDVDGAEHKARVLVQQALANLRAQKGFAGAASLADLLAPLRRDDAAWLDQALKASLGLAAQAAGLSVDADLLAILGDACDQALVKREADAMRADLEALLETPSLEG